MTPEDMADLHAEVFEGPARWSVRSFAEILSDRRAFWHGDVRAFVLGRVIAGEAELLTLATRADQRRAGLARGLLAAFDEEARGREAETAFLEVAADNVPARRLYDGAGWQLRGQRSGYYGTADALILAKRL